MCIFCKIAKKEADSYIVYENENVIAFLDINPVSKGHTLVIPKEHYENILEMPLDLAKDIHNAIKVVCEKLKVFNPDGFNIVTNMGRQAGQVIMHAHVHVIPRYKDEETEPLRFGKPISVKLDEIYRAIVKQQ